MTRHVRLLVGGAVGLALLVAGTTAGPAAAAGAAHRSGTASYPDASGEDPAAPDITEITISNDDVGFLTFRVSIANRPTLGSSEIFFALNTDGNFTTGNSKWDGAEYALDLTQAGAAVGKWNGTQWDFGTPQVTFVYSYAAGVATMKVNAIELGSTKTFTFVAGAADGDAVDWAPEAGDLSYSLQIAPPVTKTAAKAPAPKAPAPKAKAKAKAKKGKR